MKYMLMQLADSALPVGGFSFSNGLETAAGEHVVHDAATLEAYTRTIMRQAARTEGVAALWAHRATSHNDLQALMETDRCLMRCRMNGEARLMLLRMGRKLAELAVHLMPEAGLSALWLERLGSGQTPGCYPVTQGMVAALAGLTEEELFAIHQYGVAVTVLNAALRCIRVSHFDTQRILYTLCSESVNLYPQVADMALEGMNAFSPEADILAAMHEKGKMRMFMN